MKHMRKTVTGRGSSLGNRSKLSVLAIALTLALSALVAVPAYAANSDAVEPTLWDSIVSFFTGEPADDGVETYAAGDETHVVDDSTMTTWESYAADSTENIGRIWTDKSVFADDVTLTGSTEGGIKVEKTDDADFMVSLSALSSASSSVTYSSKPLDIVLVLDTSGSMTDPPHMGTTETYSPVYSRNVQETSASQGYYGWSQTNGGTYYALVDGEYVRITEEIEVVHEGYVRDYYDHVSWQLNDQEVWPKTGANDNAENHIQFYRYAGQQTITKLDALKDAATAFINQTAQMNQGIESRDDMHRISIVSYSGSASTRNNLTVVDQQGASELSDTIEGLSASGSTAADYAFDATESVLNGARSDAQKVVIFFTDGEPNHGNGFQGSVAAATVNTAHDLKANKTTIYTVGVFQGAAPTDDPTADRTEDFDKFMHAVSSNYPAATAVDRRGDASWNSLDLGDRVQNSDYYKAATNADELNNIFSDIAEDMASAAANSPTQVDEGADPNQSGYITFTDTLGDYMEVKGFNSIVFANSSNTKATKTTSGNTDTYVFEGTFPGNNVYTAAELSNIKITVTHGSGSAGDTVTVQIPASIIPLRYFDVNTASDGTSTMNVTPAYPLRVFYSVGLRDGVDLANPDEALQTYISNNSADGKVNFYSNDFTKNAALGNTTASFEPAEGNSFYYFPVATPLYVKNSSGEFVRATGPYSSNTQYYYLNNYFSDEGGTITAHPDNYVEVSNSTLAGHTYNTGWGEGNYLMVRAHTPKLNRIDDINDQKGENKTGTATTAISPDWADNNSVINVSLGNNGRLSVELPGTLAVTKNVTAEEGFTAPTGVSFEFRFDITSLPQGVEQNKRYDAQVFNADGTTAGSAFTIASGEKHSITAGQTMKIYDLSAGTQYSVTEVGAPDGFTQTDPADNGAQTGTIVANQTATASFTNTYSADPATLGGKTYLDVTKVFKGRDWHKGESYTFTLMQSANNPDTVTLPEDVTLDFDDQTNNTATGFFGDIELPEPGQYTFFIDEQAPAEDAKVPGVDYSSARYRVTLIVEDNGSGQLSVNEQSVTVVQVRNDDGQDVTNGQNVDTATFTNNYNANAGTADVRGEKDYQNESGANDLTDGKFTFKIEALGGYATADGAPAEGEGYAIAATDVPMPKNEAGETVVEVGNVGESFAFPTISYGPNTVDNTYVYEVTEVTGNEAGMTYSKKEFIVTVAVTDDTEDADGNAIIVATVTYPACGVSFTNTFDPEDATLSGEDALGGTKVIDGRDFKAGETFGFTLAPTAETQTAIDNGYVVMPADDGLTATASADTQGAFSFGEVKFTRTGTYKFTINETAHNGKALPGDVVEGMKYDQHTCTVSVTVGLGTGDNAGKLVVTGVDYGTYNQKAGNQFTNTYEANIDYGDAAGGLQVGKTLTGRAMTVGEFNFTITGVDSSVEDAVSADEANKLLAQGDGSFSNDKNCASGEEDVMTKLVQMSFDQDQADKVFVYEVREVVPAEGSADRLGGVTYDGTVWTVAIKVVDNLDGTMHTETTVSNGTDSNTYNSDNLETDGTPKVTFANSYDATPTTEDVSGSFAGTKTFAGRDMAQDETFDFTLVGADEFTRNALTSGDVTVGSTARSVSGLADGVAGNFGFGNATFKTAGTYVFNVSETVPDDAINADVNNGQTTYVNASTEEKAETGWEYEGITYDTHVGTVTIVVEDNLNGQMVVKSKSATGMAFANSYTAEPVTFGIDGHWDFAKVIDGRDWLDTDSFTFQITAAPGMPLPDGGTDLQTGYGKVITVATPDAGAADGAQVSFDFGTIEFDFNDMNGTSERYFSYTVSEQPSTIAGITTSGATYDMVITVKDDGNGQLEIASWTLTQKENDKGETLANPVQLADDETAVFTNTYSADSDHVLLSGAKTYIDYSRPQGTDQLESGMFSFKLEALGGYVTNGGSADDLTIDAANAPMPANAAQGATTVTEKNAEGAWTFQNITFTQAHDGNTYLYKVTEVVPDEAVNQNVNGGQTCYADANDTEKATSGWTLNGISYDSSTYVASVAVSTTTNDQDHTAQIVATTTYTKDGQEYTVTPETPLAFANSYDPEDAVLAGETAIKGTKTMDGRAIKKDETFTFELTPADQRTQAAVDAKVITIADDDWSATTSAGTGGETTADFTFGDITISNVGVAQGDGTYTFNVSETLPVSGQNPYQGVTYDRHVATVTVIVSDPETAGIGSGRLTATVTYDNDTQGVVTDEDRAETDKAAFTNVYKADPVTVDDDTEASFGLTKQLTGRDDNEWLDTDEFSFTLTPGDVFGPDGNKIDGEVAPMPTEGLNADGTKTVTVGADDVTDAAKGIAPINFGSIEYTKAGTYTYTVKETNAGKTTDGVTFASNEVTITVTVEDKSEGKLVASVVKTGEAMKDDQAPADASFVNTYDSTFSYGAQGNGGLEITKQLNNRDMTSEQFEFTVTATGNNADKAAAKLGLSGDARSVTLKSTAAKAGEAASVSPNPFNDITFSKADDGMAFTYTIAEVNAGDKGYTYDGHTYTVTITPQDNGNGTMSVTTVVEDGAGNRQEWTSTPANPVKASIAFVNAYEPGEATVGANGDATIVAHKTLNNDVIGNYDGQFTFTVYQGNVTVATGSNDASGNIAFTDIHYTSEELYKAVNGGSDLIGSAVKTTDPDTGVEKYTFTYSVKEDALTGDNGVSYVEGNGGVTVTVTDDHTGKLGATVSYDDPDAQSIEFVNEYGAGKDGSMSISIEGTKSLKGMDGAKDPTLEAEQFTFTIKGNPAADGTVAPMPSEKTAKNTASGAVSFGPITYTMENVFGTSAVKTDEATDAEAASTEDTDAEAVANEGIELYTADRTKVFTYEITEEKGGRVIDGITYDGSTQIVEVTVTDEGNGVISAEVTKVSDKAEGEDDFTFTNEYRVTPEPSSPNEGSGALAFTKVWDRQGGTRALAAGDFTFQLVNTANKEEVYTAVNDAKGNVAFDPITFRHEGDYTYTLSEVVPEGAAAVDGGWEKDGVLYLNTSFTVTAHVTDNHNGTLSVTWSMKDASGNDATEAKFVNTYFVDSTSVTFGAIKKLDGREIENGEFTFELRDAQGNVLGTAKNDANGKIVFADAVQGFGNVGEFDFVIAEALPEDDDAAAEGIQKDGVTYDETTYTAHVVVSDDNKGNLFVSELTYNGEASLPVFTNTYTEPAKPIEPEEPKPVIPQTGDTTNMVLPLVLAVGGVALVAGALTVAKRRSK